MTVPWPFSQWGLDIMGPFPTAVRQLKFLVVGIDYFTKWVKTEALATIMEKNIQSFVWKNIICRYGIPRVMVSDNGKQFDNIAFRNFCLELGIKNHYSSPVHLQANGQVKVTNRSLLKIIKTRLEEAKGNQSEELPRVLWIYWTTARTPIRETPFRLVYGSEAVIPAEVGLTSYRVDNHDERRNDEAMRLQLDLLDKVKAIAEQRLACTTNRKQNLTDSQFIQILLVYFNYCNILWFSRVLSRRFIFDTMLIKYSFQALRTTFGLIIRGIFRYD